MKEWLSYLLSDSFVVCKNPKSYNSQVGVPLSVWLMNEENNLAIYPDSFDRVVNIRCDNYANSPIVFEVGLSKTTANFLNNNGQEHKSELKNLRKKLAKFDGSFYDQTNRE